MSWKVVLTGNEVVLDYLSKTLDDKELSIVMENKEFILKSECFDLFSDYHEVKGKVIELLNSVNAVALLFLQSQKKLEYKIYQLREDGTVLVPLELVGSGVGSAICGLSGGSGEYNVIRDCRKLAEEYDSVKDIFQLINSDFDTWYTLYKIHEIIRKVEKFTPVFEGIDYNKESRRFQQTANSYRHADKKANPPPPNPMSLSESENFIRAILIQWLDIKERELFNK